MEYDKSTTSGPQEAVPAAPDGQHTTSDDRAHLRIKSDEDVDISVLAQPITFEFSGRTAMNRFLKAPMTERLCRWNDEDKGEDIVSLTSSLPVSSYPIQSNPIQSNTGSCPTNKFSSTTSRHTEATQPPNTPTSTNAGAKAISAS